MGLVLGLDVVFSLLDDAFAVGFVVFLGGFDYFFDVYIPSKPAAIRLRRSMLTLPDVLTRDFGEHAMWYR